MFAIFPRSATPTWGAENADLVLPRCWKKLRIAEMHPSRVKIGLVQNACGSCVEENLARAIRGIREAASRGANIVCLQELFLSQYFCQVEAHKYFDLAESVPGPTSELMQALARDCGVVLVASLFEFRAPGLYHNTAAIIDADGEFLGK